MQTIAETERKLTTTSKRPMGGANSGAAQPQALADVQTVTSFLRMLKRAVELSDDVVMITDSEPKDVPWPRVVYVNAAFERMTGYAPEEIIGMTPRILQGPKTDRAALDCIREALLARKPVRVELVNYRKDGTEFSSELSILPVADENGLHTHWFSIQRDTTEQYLLRERLILAQEDLLNLAERMQATIEEERLGISQRLHDEVGQWLTAFKMDLEWIIRLHGRGNKTWVRLLKNALTVVDDVVDRVREISSGLRPDSLGSLGLRATIEWETVRFARRSGIACSTHLDEEDVFLPDDKAIAVFRIFKEAITNIARHAGATNASITLMREGSELVLKVEDDGIGFSSLPLPARTLGLLIMRERAAFLGAQLHLEGVPGEGASLTLRTPLGAPLTRSGGQTP